MLPSCLASLLFFLHIFTWLKPRFILTNGAIDQNSIRRLPEPKTAFITDLKRQNPTIAPGLGRIIDSVC